MTLFPSKKTKTTSVEFNAQITESMNIFKTVADSLKKTISGINVRNKELDNEKALLQKEQDNLSNVKVTAELSLKQIPVIPEVPEIPVKK